jgi:hypothetical protein
MPGRSRHISIRDEPSAHVVRTYAERLQAVVASGAEDDQLALTADRDLVF